MSEQAEVDAAELLEFIENAYARGLSRDQVADAVVAHGYTLKQVVDALPTGWRVMNDAELLEFLRRR
jgi:hypothetical protein